MRNQAGISLIEILLAVALVTVVVSMISLIFPKASQNILRNRQRLAATNLATSRIEELKTLPYAYLDVSASGAFTSPANATCDCAAQDFDAFSDLEPITSNGVTYTRRTCVNYVAYVTPNWTSQCLPDSGYKNIRVRVSWQMGQDTLYVEQESSAIRL